MGRGADDLLICILGCGTYGLSSHTLSLVPLRHSESYPLERYTRTPLFMHRRLTTIAGGFKDIANVLLTGSSEISRACRIPPQEANKIIATICQERIQPLRSLGELLAEEHDEMFTTGDSELDSVLGGGVRTGMVWEAVGER